MNPVAGVTTIENFAAGPMPSMEKIENHTSWHGNSSLENVAALLENKSPHTYIITASQKPHYYWLSYVRNTDCNILHTQFDDVAGEWHYSNACESYDPRLEVIIRRAMHLNPAQPDPTPLPFKQ